MCAQQLNETADPGGFLLAIESERRMGDATEERVAVVEISSKRAVGHTAREPLVILRCYSDSAAEFLKA